MTRDECRYAPYYCEENIYRLCERKEFEDREAAVLFISNRGRQVAMTHQRSSDGTVVWDYHVVLVAGRLNVYDLDSTLPFPVPVARYLRDSFPRYVPAGLRPLFRLMPAAAYLRQFYSDRRHMIRSDGSFAAPPPPWPMIRSEEGSNLSELIDMTRSDLGPVLSASALLQRLGRRGA